MEFKSATDNSQSGTKSDRSTPLHNLHVREERGMGNNITGDDMGNAEIERVRERKKKYNYSKGFTYTQERSNTHRSEFNVKLLLSLTVGV